MVQAGTQLISAPDAGATTKIAATEPDFRPGDSPTVFEVVHAAGEPESATSAAKLAA
jgi:hypothetical protein